ncbi:Alpha/Beta hydrolase protein [Syncephalis pseudoplumigaleata]|uniref:Alpha/Beta hydrolase protein n=1 Tax=Syncephalis pseudoplumigaleata TaxID=1712513 RepID=A0A4P9Z043_9FUNG|nr:Alpha/Beta hydrolase protein [Syncephalis pseudoplumigaleata]|eukprot:RKP25744.1 Alpha/Beta hydrolase protein [Syncephalis pseudoplumigaleata]
MSQSAPKRPNILVRASYALLRLGVGLAVFAYDYAFRIWFMSLIQFRLPWKRALSSPKVGRAAALEALLNQDPAYGKHRLFEVDGNTYHCVESGSSSGKLILLLHGFPQCWYSWRHQLKEFGNTSDYHVVAVDLKGYGGSFKPTASDEYTPYRFAEDIEKIVRALGHDTCILVGHDWGGIIAWYCAALRPAFIEKLAIINAPHPAVMGRNIALRNPNVSMWESLKQLYISRYIAVIQLPWPFHTIYMTWRNYEWVRVAASDVGQAAPEDVDTYVSSFALPGVASCSSAYYRSLLKPGASIDAPIHVPTVVIWGNQDIALREEVCLTGLEDIVEDLQICIIDGATHFCPESSHQRVNHLLREFIQKGNDIETSET